MGVRVGDGGAAPPSAEAVRVSISLWERSGLGLGLVLGVLRSSVTAGDDGEMSSRARFDDGILASVPASPSESESGVGLLCERGAVSLSAAS